MEGITKNNILVSIVLAIIHIVFELISLYVEASTSETPFKNYLVACYNARQYWVP